MEDNQWWFPWNRGSCGNVWSLLATAPETLLDITLLWFAQSTLGPPLFAADPTYQVRPRCVCRGVETSTASLTTTVLTAPAAVLLLLSDVNSGSAARATPATRTYGTRVV